MPVLEVLIYGHPFLRKKVREVKVHDESLAELAWNMIETMNSHDAVGLAAPQVGFDARLIVIDPGRLREDPLPCPMVLINPHILSAEGQSVYNEGCLSIPNIYADVRRPETITVQFQDKKGQTHQSLFSGVESRIIQHEVDHLDGVLFIDHLNPVKRWLLKRKLDSLKKRLGGVHLKSEKKGLTA